MKIQFCNAFTDEVAVASNPEMADMGNPNGFIFRRRLFVEAVTESGRRFIYQGFFANADVADRFVSRVQAKGEINLEFWGETYSIYGSPAWQNEDAERNANFQIARARGDEAAMERYS